ncbi:MAG: globin family protein [Gammaproteobacteria bacterium]
MLTSEQITFVKDSWSKVVPIAPAAAELFYGRLFELDPSLKPMFKGNMVEQGEKLMKMIGVAVDNLDRLDEIVPAVQDLGVRHLDYGVRNSHYDTVGAALLWTLEQGLGDVFTPGVKQAWTDVYMLLASTMKEAATAAA